MSKQNGRFEKQVGPRIARGGYLLSFVRLCFEARVPVPDLNELAAQFGFGTKQAVYNLLRRWLTLAEKQTLKELRVPLLVMYVRVLMAKRERVPLYRELGEMFDVCAATASDMLWYHLEEWEIEEMKQLQAESLGSVYAGAESISARLRSIFTDLRAENMSIPSVSCLADILNCRPRNIYQTIYNLRDVSLRQYVQTNLTHPPVGRMRKGVRV